MNKASSYLFPGFLTLGLAAFGLAKRRESRRVPHEVESTSSSSRLMLAWDAAILFALATALLIEAAGGIRWEIFSVSLSARSGARAGWLFVVLTFLRLAVARHRPFSFSGHMKKIIFWLKQQAEARAGLTAGFYALLIFFSLWAALGPRFGLYSALYRLLPGFDFIRGPGRLTILTLLGLAVLAGFGVERLLTVGGAGAKKILGTATSLLLVVELLAAPLPVETYEVHIPGIDAWLATQPTYPMAELPVADPREAIRAARLHSLYMIHGMAHWMKMVNGYSGLTPDRHDALFRKLASFPDEQSLAALEKIGVRYVIIHSDLYPPGEWSEVIHRIHRYRNRLTLVRVEGEGRAYLLNP